MTDGWLFLGLSSLICAGAFLVGLRFWRMPEDEIDRVQWEMLFWTNRKPIERVRLFAKIMMIGAPVFFVVCAALAFGLLGPVEGMRTIEWAKGERTL